MKIPLGYQMSEYDCCPTTFTNAIKFLFKRSEVPGDIVNGIYNYTLDRAGGRGTNREATEALVNWLNDYSKRNKFNLECKRYSGNIIDTELIKKEFDNNTVIILRLWLQYEHYVLVTKVEEDYLYLFDPYCDIDEAFKGDNETEVLDEDIYNRKVKLNRFDSTNKKLNYALGEYDLRECVVLRRK